MDFNKIWDSVVAFFREGYNLYYVVGGVALLLIIIIAASAAARSRKKKKALSDETVAAAAPAPEVKRTTKPNKPSNALNAPIAVEKPAFTAAKPAPKQNEKAKVAIMTPAPAPAKPAPAESQAPKSAAASSPEKEENDIIEEALKRPGIIQIYKDNSERFRFRIKASNSYIVGHSQGYSTKYACKGGISAIANMVDAETVDTTKQDYKPTIGRPVFEIYKDNENKFRFRLRAANTNNILASQGYTTKENCYNGIKSIKHIILNNTLQDLTTAQTENK